MRPAEQLYESYMETNLIGGFSSIESDFPNVSRIPGIASAEVLTEFSQLMSPDDFKGGDDKGFSYRMLVSGLMNEAISKGSDRFELDTHGMKTFPYYVGSDRRVQLILHGELGHQAIKGGRNLDVLVNGNVGDHVGIFGKNSRIYVTGTAGASPMSQSDNCVLDAQSVGPNQLMIQDGVIVSRDDVTGNFYDRQKWSDYLDEGAPLIGPTNFLIKNRWAVRYAMKRSNTTFLSAGEAKKPYTHIEYERPNWIPR